MSILYEDPETRCVSNHWIAGHEHGHPAGFCPLLVLDVWECAFMADRPATARASYVDAFLTNVNWPVVERRFLGQPASETTRSIT